MPTIYFTCTGKNHFKKWAWQRDAKWTWTYCAMRGWKGAEKEKTLPTCNQLIWQSTPKYQRSSVAWLACSFQKGCSHMQPRIWSCKHTINIAFQACWICIQKFLSGMRMETFIILPEPPATRDADAVAEQDWDLLAAGTAAYRVARKPISTLNVHSHPKDAHPKETSFYPQIVMIWLCLCFPGPWIAVSCFMISEWQSFQAMNTREGKERNTAQMRERETCGRCDIWIYRPWCKTIASQLWFGKKNTFLKMSQFLVPCCFD